MPYINADVAKKGVAFTQSDAVTAFFPTGCDERRLTQALTDVGVPDSDIYYFIGPTGAERLGSHSGVNGSLWDRFWREFERETADEEFIYEKADAMLRGGGTLVVVFTDDDLERRAKTIGALKDSGGEHLVHTGDWTFEEIG